MHYYRKVAKKGFTLIEMAIVLVILGLLAGGVLVGQDLIATAAIHSQLAQIQQYREGVHTFEGKYHYLPGDIKAALVAQYGFPAIPVRAGTRGQGDGSGLIEGICCASLPASQGALTAGEPAWFWVDLTANSQLIAGNFTSANPTPLVDTPTLYYSYANPSLSLILPNAAIGGRNFIYIVRFNGANYYGLSAISQMDKSGALYNTSSTPGLTPMQAYGIDAKIDDGIPQTGSIIARHADWNRHNNLTYPDGLVWAAGGTASAIGAADTSATLGSSATCYDNAGVTGALQQYSITQSSANANCGLLIKFQ